MVNILSEVKRKKITNLSAVLILIGISYRVAMGFPYFPPEIHRDEKQ